MSHSSSNVIFAVLYACMLLYVLPKSCMSLNLNNIQRVEVGHKQIRLSECWKKDASVSDPEDPHHCFSHLGCYKWKTGYQMSGEVDST